MLEGRDDLAVLWDIRVSPGSKRRGVGRALFAEAIRWSREQGMTTLKIETQNINVPACKFYSSQGAHLGAINRFAYRDAPWSHPDVRSEVMLLWYYQLPGDP
jgi:ribosomal protein S18 acetylase RimI-like enzyme